MYYVKPCCCVVCSSEPSQLTTDTNKQQSHQQQLKQLQLLLEKTKADLIAEKHAGALSNKEAASLRVLLKVRMSPKVYWYIILACLCAIGNGFVIIYNLCY